MQYFYLSKPDKITYLGSKVFFTLLLCNFKHQQNHHGNHVKIRRDFYFI